MSTKSVPQRKRHRWLSILLCIVAGIVLLPILLVLVFQLNPVQRFAKNKVESYLRNKFHTTVFIGGLRLNWWNSLLLEKLYIGDKAEQPLLYSGSLNVSFNLLALIKNKLVVKKLQWDDVLINVYRKPNDSTYNFQFVIDAFNSPQEQKDTLNDSGTAMTWSIGNVELNKFRVRFADDPNGMNAIAVWNSLIVKPKTIKPEKSYFDINKVAIEQGKVLYSDKRSGTATFWNIGELVITDTKADITKNTIEAGDVKIHGTGGSLGLQKGTAEAIADTVAERITTVVAADTITKTAWIFKVKNIDIDQLHVKYDQLDVAASKNAGAMDLNHLDVRDIRLQARDAGYYTDSIMVDLNELTLKDKSGFAVRRFQGDLLYSDKIIALRNLLLQTNKSRLASEVVVEVPSWATIKDNLDQLRVNVVLENTHIDLPEIARALPDLQNNPSLKPIFQKIIDANGRVTGTMQQLQINELNVADNNGSRLYMTGVVQNASDPGKLIATIKELDVRSGGQSIKSWLPAGTIADSISIPAQIHLTGSGMYSKQAIRADLKLNSSSGDITINGTAASYMDKNNSRYDVRVPLLKLDAGKLLNDTTLGFIDISLSAKGQGYDYERLTANINLLIKEAVYKKYPYRDINAKATLNKGDFTLLLDSRDPNLLTKLEMQGALDSLRRNVSGSINIERADLYATHWTTSPLTGKLNTAIDIDSFLPRHLKGDVFITGIQLADDSALYALDTLRLTATDTLSRQQLGLTGPFGFITANGDYDYTKAFMDIAKMVQRHLQPDSAGRTVAIAASMRTKGASDRASGGLLATTTSPVYTTTPARSQERSSGETQIMDVNAALLWPRSLQHLMPGLSMRHPLQVTAHINTDSSLLKADFNIPSLGFNAFNLDTLRGTVTNTTDSLAASIYLAALAHPQFPLDKTMIDIGAANGRVTTDINLLDKDEKQKYSLGALLTFLPDNGLLLSLKPDLILNKQSWTVSDKNEVRIENGALRSADLMISNRGQSLGVRTVSSKGNATPDLEATVNQFRLSTITAILGKDSLFAEGVATGRAMIANYDQSPGIDAKLTVDSIKMMNTSVGTLTAEANTTQADVYNVKAQLTGNDNDVQVQGTYAQQMDFKVDLNRLNMKSVEPFTMGSVSRMKGTTSGQITLKGTADAPQIRGTLKFDSVAAAITAIGTYLKIPAEQLVIDDKGITFDNFTVTDSLNHPAVIDGRIATNDYKDYRFQLTLKAENFMALGPKQSPDQILYGPAFIDADARIRGTMDLPRLDLTLKLRDSSNFTLVVPENNPGVADREGVIVFVNKGIQPDSSLLQLKDTVAFNKPAGMQGIALNAKIEITPSSLLKIIIDQQNGDYLEAKGTANLDATMSPNSDLTITGRYELNEGKYNMSLNNLIKRSFSIVKGSSITFQGGVTNALVDITAKYSVLATAGDLVQDQLVGASDTRRTQFKQKVPVDVYLEIKNQLLKPQISFRLDMPEKDRNDLNGVVYNRIRQINTVESELNKQVMGLLVLNSFIPDNPLDLFNDRGGSGVEGTARKSVSKLISQQLNNFAGNLIKGFDVNFDLQSQDDYTTGTLQNSTNLNIGVSKSLFNDRISVSVGSSVNLEGPQQTQQASTLVGDVSVDYKVTPDGKYRVRAYRQNETDAIVEGQIIETGVSFIFVIDYNELRELFHSKKKPETTKRPKREKKKE